MPNEQRWNVIFIVEGIMSIKRNTRRKYFPLYYFYVFYNVFKQVLQLTLPIFYNVAPPSLLSFLSATCVKLVLVIYTLLLPHAFLGTCLLSVLWWG